MDEHKILAGVERCLAAVVRVGVFLMPLAVCLFRGACFVIAGTALAAVVIADAVTTDPKDRDKAVREK